MEALEKMATSVDAPQKTKRCTKKVHLGLQLDMASQRCLVADCGTCDATSALAPLASRRGKNWKSECRPDMIRMVENHRFLMFFLPLKSKIESPRRRNAHFHSWVTRLPIEMNVHVANIFWRLLQIPAFFFLPSKIRIPNSSPLQGRRVNRLPCFPCVRLHLRIHSDAQEGSHEFPQDGGSAEEELQGSEWWWEVGEDERILLIGDHPGPWLAGAASWLQECLERAMLTKLDPVVRSIDSNLRYGRGYFWCTSTSLPGPNGDSGGMNMNGMMEGKKNEFRCWVSHHAVWLFHSWCLLAIFLPHQDCWLTSLLGFPDLDQASRQDISKRKRIDLKASYLFQQFKAQQVTVSSNESFFEFMNLGKIHWSMQWIQYIGFRQMS